MIQLIQQFDNLILISIKNNMHGYIADKIMIMSTDLGNMAIAWVVIAIALIISKRYRKVGVMVLAALLLSTILGEVILKNLVKRPRPCFYIPQVDMIIKKPTSYSFPSGHAMSSFAAAGVISKYLKKYAVVFYVLALVIAFSRLYLYVHYPTDVIVGIILGIIVSRFVIHIFNKIKKIE
ncbi:MAG: phosphatase PAP2 family protein [Clostridium sp.]|nr:phosphatase PAP2 family protein [Clostridium sp.]